MSNLMINKYLINKIIFLLQFSTFLYGDFHDIFSNPYIHGGNTTLEHLIK